MRYIAKKDTWFKEGTEAILLYPIDSNFASFKGIRIVNGLLEAKNNKLNIKDQFLDTMICNYNEFIIEEE